jgi:glucan phosphoethanolaminetransferase (alkaline phosphatase superfamily)
MEHFEKPLSKIWWLWVPLAVMALQIPMEIFLSHDVLMLLHSEQGPHEFVEFLILVAAFFIAVMTLLRMDRKQKWLAAWTALAAICCFYVAGEEVSWGQKFVQWSTPEFWAHLNDQGETNLHNTSSWFDQKPRILLLIGVIGGGILIPLARRFKLSLLPKKFEIVYPPNILWVIAFITFAVEATDKLSETIGASVFARGSEVVELYLFYFVLLYLVVLRRRILQNQR